MERGDEKQIIMRAFFELAWSEGEVSQVEADFLSQLTIEMDLSLGERLPLLVQGLAAAPKEKVTNLADVLLDDMERYHVVERMVTLCLLKDELPADKAFALAGLALQLGIKAEELEEMRRRAAC